MGMTTGDELGESDVFVKLAMTLSPLAEEAVQQSMTVKEFDCGLFGGLLCTGRPLIDQFLITLGVSDLGETTVHPADSSNDHGTESRKLHRSPELAGRMLRTVLHLRRDYIPLPLPIPPQSSGPLLTFMFSPAS